MAINDPRDISGLVLWYSAEHEAANYTNGQSMTGWTDLSGNGNHATAVGTLAPQWESTTGPGSGPAVKFRGTHGTTSATWGYFSLPASVMGSAAAGEILAAIKADGPNCSQWGLGASAGTTVQSHYPFSSVVYETFGTNSRKTTFSDGDVAINVWRRYNVWSASADYASRVDGVTRFSTTTNTVLWDAAPIIGHGKRNGAPSDNTGSFKGHMAAVIIYNRKLTTTERADLDAWLVANPNGGIAVNIPEVDADLTGTGAFTATVSEVEKAAASLTGTGTFSATVVPVQSVSASLTGSGALTATSYEVLSATGSMTGSGTLTADSAGVHTATGAMSGTGEFTASISTDTLAEVDADLTGSGAFTATSYPVFSVDADLTGSGAVTATSYAVRSVTGTMTGAGTFSATAVQVEVVQVEGDLTGGGTFTATAVEVEVYSVEAELSGAGTFTVTTTPIATVEAFLEGSGVFSIGGFVGKPIVRGVMRLTGADGATVLAVNTVVGWIVLPDGTAQRMERSDQVLVDASSADTLTQWQNGGETIVVSPVLP